LTFSKVLRPTQHEIGHFGDSLPSQSLGYYWENKRRTRRCRDKHTN